MVSPSSATTHTAPAPAPASTTSAIESHPGPATVYETYTISGSPPPTSTTTTRIVTADSTQTYLLGPLTTTFTAPSRCNQAYWFSSSSRVYDPTLGQICTNVGGQADYNQDTSCLPPVKSTILGSLVGGSDILYTTYNYKGYYSPGIACPAGYSTACAAQAGADGIRSALSSIQSFGFVYAATADETVVGCCPTGYQCTSLLSTQWCQRVIASTTQPLVTCMNGTNGAPASTTTLFILPTTVTLSSSDTLLSTEVTATTNLTTLSMLATMIQINFQATDLTSTATLSSSSSFSTLSSTSLPTYPTSTDSGSSSGSNNHHKTTTIAISVVIPCVAVLIAASLGWLWYRRRARKQQPSTAYQAVKSSEPTEMRGDPSRHEMEGSPVAYEMANANLGSVMHEMYAGK
ncbi:hypothetical protein TMatcc_009792 [Talaromyces marneffei ATCC 18224]|uniref:Uncharacterized protein n=1 Tax=Talaromyces marneffei (strain ATCC 18224 / CBS 334.59 / QM 7333) TaxID=441960 RepID=B6QT55_TALMQ|nr:uncharacterized protein EYB26_009025 [Talaromyces marneffei]EEA19655.1 conserved hypothetical protein [Talaromyces marneffei ATCC 18224]QGA21315.1 hypothetical protein EYB26_009025 [Talaromyces marneffei]